MRPITLVVVIESDNVTNSLSARCPTISHYFKLLGELVVAWYSLYMHKKSINQVDMYVVYEKLNISSCQNMSRTREDRMLCG